jgi:hypothetical protein
MLTVLCKALCSTMMMMKKICNVYYYEYDADEAVNEITVSCPLVHLIRSQFNQKSSSLIHLF